MRKIALLSTLLVTTVIMVISCQKNQHLNSGNNPYQGVEKYNANSGESSVGQMHGTMMVEYDALHGWTTPCTDIDDSKLETI